MSYFRSSHFSSNQHSIYTSTSPHLPGNRYQKFKQNLEIMKYKGETYRDALDRSFERASELNYSSFINTPSYPKSSYKSKFSDTMNSSSASKYSSKTNLGSNYTSSISSKRSQSPYKYQTSLHSPTSAFPATNLSSLPSSFRTSPKTSPRTSPKGTTALNGSPSEKFEKKWSHLTSTDLQFSTNQNNISNDDDIQLTKSYLKKRIESFSNNNDRDDGSLVETKIEPLQDSQINMKQINENQNNEKQINDEQIPKPKLNPNDDLTFTPNRKNPSLDLSSSELRESELYDSPQIKSNQKTSTRNSSTRKNDNRQNTEVSFDSRSKHSAAYLTAMKPIDSNKKHFHEAHPIGSNIEIDTNSEESQEMSNSQSTIKPNQENPNTEHKKSPQEELEEIQRLYLDTQKKLDELQKKAQNADVDKQFEKITRELSDSQSGTNDEIFAFSDDNDTDTDKILDEFQNIEVDE